MSTPAIHALVDAYLAGPGHLRALVADLSPEQLRARPIPGKWSVLEVVAHLADFEPILADRMKRIIALDRPLLLSADENLFAQHLAYHDRDLAEELHLIEAIRVPMARILRSLPAETYQKAGVHSHNGLRTLEQFLQGATNHILHHLPFIREKRSALGLASAQ